MNYKWEDSQKSCQIELLTPEEFQRLYAEKFPRSFKGNELEQIRFFRQTVSTRECRGHFQFRGRKTLQQRRFGLDIIC